MFVPANIQKNDIQTSFFEKNYGKTSYEAGLPLTGRGYHHTLPS